MRSTLLVAASLVASLGVVLADPIGVNPTGDASGEILAVSGTGSTSCENCIAASGAGNAHSHWLAVSGLGNADGCETFTDPWGTSEYCSGIVVSAAGSARGSTAASVLGDADACSTFNGEPYYCGQAASVAGDARGYVAVSVLGETYGTIPFSVAGTCNDLPCIVVSPDGPAQAGFLGASGTGASDGALAVSLLGPSRAVLVAASGAGPASGIWAASVAGDSTGSFAASLLGDAAACDYPGSLCTAVSVAGDAHGVVPVSVLGRCNDRACIVVSPDGDADAGFAGASVGGASGGALAASATGPVDGTVLGASATGTASSSWVGVSAAGDADGCETYTYDGFSYESCSGFIVSGLGDARGNWAFAGAGDARGELLAVSGGGDADSTYGFGAVSLLGDADACSPWCWCGGIAASGGGDATGQHAASVLGDARATCSFGQACVAVSGTGHASGGDVNVSGCDALQALCGNPLRP